MGQILPLVQWPPVFDRSATYLLNWRLVLRCTCQQASSSRKLSVLDIIIYTGCHRRRLGLGLWLWLWLGLGWSLTDTVSRGQADVTRHTAADVALRSAGGVDRTSVAVRRAIYKHNHETSSHRTSCTTGHVAVCLGLPTRFTRPSWHRLNYNLYIVLRRIEFWFDIIIYAL